MNIVIKINDTRVRELIEDANARYWARGLALQEGSLAFTIIEHGGIHEPDCGGETTHAVTEEMIIAGLTKMANAGHNEGGHYFAEVRDWKQGDGWTGDAVIQFAIFGEMKYG